MKNKITPLFLLALLVFSAQTSFAHEVCLDLSKNLKAGMGDVNTSGQVSQLQDFLVDQGYLKSDITGYFGKLTLKAVKDFQKDNNLPPTGFVWNMTRTLLKNKTCLNVSTNTNNQPTVTTPQVTTPIVQNTPTVSIPTLKLPIKIEDFSAWKGTWGDVYINHIKQLVIKASTTTTGAEAIFTDSMDLTDYRINANIYVKNGDVTLIARYKDYNNFLGCTFSGNQVSVIQRLNGETTRLNSAVLSDLQPSAYFQKSLSLGMTVYGNKVGCRILGNEDNVISNNIDQSLLKGGIGISTFLTNPGDASLELQSIEITSN